ncbi:non-ribosomal peptide synthetase [Rheinheimera pacifica]|uniref:non-ribosomal peptide synthetase n=1 Tax=Rheinheimera pacifica TaxID=173990 RepID=UPI000B871CEB|nr:non-ribosomal peptide synthetase [Rheinheimera pacifica]
MGYLEGDAAEESKVNQEAAIRNRLLQQLPDYMVPSVFVWVDSWPVSVNGKLDRKALPEPTETRFTGTYEAPETATEVMLTRVWAVLLGREAEDISVSISFFALGGHSLLAVRLVNAIREAFGRKLALRSVFELPTIREQAFALENANAGVNRPAVISLPRPENGLIPTSFAQQRFWFIDRLQGGSSEYNIPAAFEVDGQFDITLAQNCMQRIVGRHAILRTVYSDSIQGPVQIVKNNFAINLTVTDFSLLTDAEQSAQIKSFLVTEAGTPFDLTNDLMVRVNYLKVSSTKGTLVVNMHHIASDGWSVQVMMREFVTLYSSGLSEDVSVLPALDIQYADYAMWQHQYLGVITQHQFSYWKNQLSALPVVHNVPLDFKRPEYQSHRGALVSRRLGRGVSSGLKILAQSNGLTPFMLSHAVVALVLAKHSDNSDIIIGTPVANRLNDELSPLIGCFVNTLVLRVNTEHEDFLSYLSHVKQTHMEAQDNQDVPFEKLVEHLNVTRSNAHTPVFQIMLSNNAEYSNVVDMQQVPLELPDVRLTMQSPQSVTAKYDLSIDISFNEDNLHVGWQYDTALFTQEHIEQMQEHLCNSFIQLASLENVNTLQLEDVVLSSEKELALLQEGLNSTVVASATDTSIQGLFERQVECKPDAIALICGERKLSFQELNRKANQLANFLREEHQVGKDTLVALYVNRTIEMVVGILGIMKAGGAYVPLDPAYPDGRLSYMLEDSRAKLVLTHSGVNSPVFDGLKVYNLDDASLYTDRPVANVTPESGYDADAAAYVIYTSGSTGKPKGVLVEQRNVLNFYSSFNILMRQMGALQSNWLWHGSFSFDASVKGILKLCSGNTVVLTGDVQSSDVTKLITLMQEHNIDVLNVTPALVPPYLDALEKNNALAVHFLVGGEHLSEQLAQRMYAYTHARNKRTVNCYGPTETTINASWSFIEKDMPVSIGRPLNNTQMYVLDGKGQLAPYGAVGELFIGGKSVTRGYLNKPELTAQRFIDNPWYSEELPGSSARLYRTGDSVRYLGDGNLQFLGRKDDQVKLRGYRIELGEIENELVSCKGIYRAVVKLNGEGKNQKIVAYLECESSVLSSSEHNELESTIKASLRSQLPEYMLPSFYIWLEEWPLLPSGKLNYSLLPSVEASLSVEDYQKPETETEQKLVEIWADLLQIDSNKLSMRANFFELGGHSILILQLVTQVNSSFTVKLSVRDVFKLPVLRDMAQLIARNDVANVTDWQPLTALNNVADSEHHLYVVPGVGGISVTMLPLAIEFKESVQLTLLDNRGLNHELKPYESLQQQVDEFVHAVESNQPQGKVILVGHSFGGTVIFEMGLSLERRGREVQLILLDSVLSPVARTLIDSREKKLIQLSNLWNLSFADNFPADEESDTVYELVRQKLVKLQLVDEENSDALLQRYLYVFGKQSQWLHQYQPETRLKGKVSLIHCADGPYTGFDRESLLARIQSSVENKVSVTEVSGDHHSMLRKPHSKELAAAIFEQLNNKEYKK